MSYLVSYLRQDFCMSSQPATCSLNISLLSVHSLNLNSFSLFVPCNLFSFLAGRLVLYEVPRNVEGTKQYQSKVLYSCYLTNYLICIFFFFFSFFPFFFLAICKNSSSFALLSSYHLDFC